MDLASERCVACQPGAPTVTPDEQTELLASIPDWNIVDVNDIPHLRRVVKRKGWKPAVALANQVAELADAEDHHPAILIEWGRVTVEWWTHAIKGLHRNDFIMAAKVDSLLTANQGVEHKA
jgi:4a-hydroxytetrahydrobiopterin dehydratase